MNYRFETAFGGFLGAVMGYHAGNGEPIPVALGWIIGSLAGYVFSRMMERIEV